MFLHDHPVNEARQRRGELPINGLWFWGGGQRGMAPLRLPAKRLYGDDSLARGLAQASGESEHAPGLPVDRALLDDGPTVVIWSDAERALLGGDAEAWLTSLQRFEAEMAGIFRDLAREYRGHVELRTGNGRVHVIGPSDRWRFWRRPRPLRDWLVIE